MSEASWSSRLFACVVLGIFIIAGIFLPGMPTIGRVLWIVGPGLMMILVATPMIRSITQKPQLKESETSISTRTPVKRVRITTPWSREHYEISDEQGTLLIRVGREKGDPDETHIGAIKQALGSMVLDKFPFPESLEFMWSKFVFETPDGIHQGTIQREMIGSKYLIHDSDGGHLAVIRPIELVEGLKFRIDDPQGRLLAESDGLVTSSNYKIVSPIGGVIAQIVSSSIENMQHYDVDIFDVSFDSYLVYCYIVSVDNMSYLQKLTTGWNSS